MRKTSEEFSSSDFFSQFLYVANCLLNSDAVPRIAAEIKIILHLSEELKVGDWYLYHNFTEIRIYGCELQPYKFPIFLPMRIFSLEYIRQMMNVEDVHFVSRKQKDQFKLKAQFDPFITNTRSAGREVDNLLKQMKFKLSFSWSYDPLWIISIVRVA